MMQGMKRGSEGQASGAVKRPRSDDREVTLRVLVHSRDAGGIIGKGGQTIKRLRTDYRASVSVPDSDSSERVLSVQAQEENALEVLKECLPICGPPPYAGGRVNDSQFEIDFLIHRSQAGGVIGRAGFKIKELREQSGALIKVFEDCLPSSTERVIAIGGSEEQILTALKGVLEVMAENPIKGSIQLYDPSLNTGNEYDAYPSMGSFGAPRGGMGGPRGGRGGGPRGGRGGQRGGGGFGGGGQGGFGRGRGRGNGSSGGGGSDFMKQSGGSDGEQGFAQPLLSAGDNNYTEFSSQGGGGGGGAGFNNPDNSNETQVTIPKDLAGAIIGRGGERIRQIRQRSGADIKIEEPKPGANDRVIAINGSQEQVQYAQYLMQESVRMYSGQKSF